VRDGLSVMDSDLHVMETRDVYERYLDERFRERMPRYMGLAATNFPWWTVNGRPIPPWATDEAVVGPQNFLDAPTENIYKERRGRGFEATDALDAMDQEGIDVAVMYRTWAHMTVSIDDLEPDYAIALCRAFNDWLVDYCSADPVRLRPSAIVCLHDPELAAAEAERAVQERGHVGVVLLPMPVRGRYFHAPECDVLWAAISRLGVPLAFHGTSGGASNDYVSNRFFGHPNFRTLNHSVSFPLELMMALGSMTAGGVLERFPDLRVAFLEGNCGWLPWWLHRLDDQWEKYGGGEKTKLSALPSEYFRRQCMIGTDVDEELLRVVIDELGDDNIVVSTDYPHADGAFPHAIDSFLALDGVSRESKRKILWDNCRRLYGFPLEPQRPSDAGLASRSG
jgi:uncharacterized protein